MGKAMNNPQRKLLMTYWLSLFLYNLARVLPHAVLTVILLNKGMTVGDIALIQSSYMLAVLIFELPSGILTDLWNEKYMYLCAICLLAISYGIILTMDGFIYLCVAWFIYGMSSAAISGSLEAYFIRQFAHDNDKIKKFNVNTNNTILYSGLIGGGLGSFIYTTMETGLYVLSIGLLGISALLTLMLFRPDKSNDMQHHQKNVTHKLWQRIKHLDNRELVFNVMLLAVFQIILQLFFQFWQVLFLDTDISATYFGAFYVIFQLGAIVANHIFKQRDFKKRMPLLILLVPILLFLAIQNSQNSVMFVVFILLFLIPFNLYNNQLMLNIQTKAPTDLVASTLSLSGTISSIVSMVFLWAIGYFNRIYTFNELIWASCLIFVILSLFLLWRLKQQKL